MDEDQVLAAKFAAILPHLNERQRRLVLAAEARALGRGGVTRVARAAGVTRPTIHAAAHELDTPGLPNGRVRQAGGGRKRETDRDPTVLTDLEAIIDPQTRGDPMSPLRRVPFGRWHKALTLPSPTRGPTRSAKTPTTARRLSR